MKKKIILLVVIVLVVAIGAGVFYYFHNKSANFFTTENAKISADSVTITPLLTGSVLSWDIKEGDEVHKGQLLGRQDTSTSMTSSAINLQTLNNAGDSLLSKADIKSPIDGKVVQSDVLQGETISPGMQCAIIADTSNIYITANIEETSIFKIKPGQKVDIKIDAYPQKQFTGYVQSISQASQNAFSAFANITTSGTFSKTTQLIPVKINIVNNDNLPLLLGMNAVVTIHIGK